MTHSNENIGAALLFFGTWYAVSEHAAPFFSENSFVVTLLLWGIGSLTIKLAGRAVFRLGERGWMLMAQVVVWFVLFLWFVPATPVIKILTLWGIALPLMFTGAIARLGYERFPQWQQNFDGIPKALGPMVLVPLPLIGWNQGYGFWLGLAIELAVCAMAAIPLYYGWALAEPLPRGERDARFGGKDDYRTAGMSDER